jgi:hypothetical protein
LIVSCPYREREEVLVHGIQRIDCFIGSRLPRLYSAFDNLQIIFTGSESGIEGIGVSLNSSLVMSGDDSKDTNDRANRSPDKGNCARNVTAYPGSHIACYGKP